MEINNQPISPEITSQPTKMTQHIEPNKQPTTNKLLTPILIIALILSLCIAGIFTYQNFQFAQEKNNQSKLEAEQKQQEREGIVKEIKSTNNSTPNPKVISQRIINPEKNCSKTFSSQHLNLKFNYDSCSWNIDEKLIEPESGVFSTITATHSSNHKVEIKAGTIGMGGGYPDCSLVEDVYLLDNNIARIHLIGTEKWKGDWPKYYFYLTKNNDYAVKGFESKFGNENFEKYFTFLNKEIYQNSNMCWRSGGINIVASLKPKEDQTENYQINKDISIQIEEESVKDQDFLSDSDSLAVSIFSSISK